MAFSKARRLSDFIAADGTIPTGNFASSTITSAHLVDGTIAHADLHTNMDLTGKTVLVANASTGDSDTTAANTAFVQQEIAALVDSSPSALNTLNELAAALGDDASFSTTVTNSIATKLPLAGGSLTGGLVITAGNGNQLQLNNAGERFTQIGLKHSGAQNGALWLDDTDSMVDLYANTSHGIRLKTGGDNPRVTILSGGNVGIGTASPDGKFVVSNGGAEGFEVFPGSASGQNSFQHYNRSGSAYLRNRNIASEFTFNLSGATDDAVTFKAGGNVNIGYGVSNTQSTWPLHLAYSNNNGAHGGIQVKNTSTGSTSNFAGMSAHAVNGGVQAFYYAADYDTWGVGAFAGSASNHPFHLMTNNTERMRIDASGNVSIGTTGNTNRLTVSDATNISMSASAAGQLRIEGNGYSGAVALDGTAMHIYQNSSGRDIVMGNNETEQFKIHRTGEITAPQHPIFDVAIGAAGSGVRVFNVVYVNIGSNYSTTNGRFTAPVAGTYFFQTAYIKNNDTNVARRRFNKNGSALYSSRQMRTDSGQSYGDPGTVAIIVTLAVGDYVQVDQYAGSSLGSTTYDYFHGYLIA